jgi:hypothetical protein
MSTQAGSLVIAFYFLGLANAQDSTSQIPLTVPSGAPLRLYLTGKVPKRAGAPVKAKVIEPVYAFDEQVVPAGAEVSGRVARVDLLSKWQRARAMMNGDFTPLRRAQLEFNSLTLPDGRTLALHTIPTEGLHSIYTPPKPPKPSGKKPKASDSGKSPDTGVLGIGKQAARNRINQQINSRTRGVADLVRSPNRKERLVDLAMAKLPYHPQWVRRGTRFDAELVEPVRFGSEAAPAGAWALLGSQPPSDAVAHARLLTAVDSGTAHQGQTIEAVIAEPLYSPDHKVILPEGTRVTGSVVLVKKARRFHRGGQLRFSFQNFDLPAEVPAPKPAATLAIVTGAESGGATPVQVDPEGGVKATESKTRFLAPLASLVVLSRAADNDAGKHTATGGESNTSGRTLGGGSGFGLLGAAAAQSSKYVGMALGYYGLAWSVYANVVARGGEVEFPRNAAIDIRFSARKQ